MILMRLVKRRHLMKKIIILAAFIALTTGCQAMQNMEDMKDTTKGMSETTKAMSQTTNGMDKTTDKTLNSIRQGGALDIRTKHLDAMDKATTIEKKLDEATNYYFAFEFQQFSNLGSDTLARFEGKKAEAIQEFLMVIQEYISDKDSLKDVSPSCSSAKCQNLYALVTTMGLMNPVQLEYAAANGFTPVSVLDLLEQALSKRKGVNDGSIDFK